jgi:uncharacterized tellurite resistance protein B-like protein
MKQYFKSKKKLNVEYFMALMSVAMADGTLKDEEREFFSSRAEELGFPTESIQEMFATNIDELQNIKSYNVDDVDFLSDIVAMAMIDGELHEKEYELCVKLAEKRGATKADIDITIKTLNKFLNQGL